MKNKFFLLLFTSLFSYSTFANNCTFDNPPLIRLKTNQDGIVVNATVVRSSGSKNYDLAVTNHYKGKPYYQPFRLTTRKGQYAKSSQIPSPEVLSSLVLVKNRTLTVMDSYIPNLVKEDCY